MQINSDQSMSNNIMSIMKIRHELSNELLIPLPYFYIEKKVFLGHSYWQHTDQMICPHNHLMINYFDVYPPKHYKNLLYSAEYSNIENSKVLRPERQKIQSASYFYKKMLLGTTLLPASIVESLIEKDSVNKPAIEKIISIWSQKKCTECLRFYTRMKRLRIVEKYLFLRYHTPVIGKSLFTTR